MIFLILFYYYYITEIYNYLNMEIHDSSSDIEESVNA